MPKTCKTCGQSLPEELFYKDKKSTDGLARTCKRCNRTFMKTYRARERILALQAYGGENPKCSCPGCEESRIPFLSIDHVNNDGAEHRRQLRASQKRTKEVLKPGDALIKPGGSVFYRWLRINGYPLGYRVMCHNCNQARKCGLCPVHELIINT